MIYEEIGANIKKYRIMQKKSMQDLGTAINRSKAAIFKYEKGTCSIEVETLLKIANALNIDYNLLLETKEKKPANDTTDKFLFDTFNGAYFYEYDGQQRGIVLGRIEIRSKDNITLYYDCSDPKQYASSRLIYRGYGTCNGNIIYFFLNNLKHTIEHCTLAAFNPILSENHIYGFILGLSPSPLIPTVNKFIINKHPIPIDADLTNLLTFNREEMLSVKRTNTLTLVPHCRNK